MTRTNIRFLKSKVEKDEVYLIMRKCNFCPYLMVDKENYRAVCGNPRKDKSESDTILDNIMYFDGGERPVVLDDCLIPSFCVLSRNLKDEFENEELKYKKNDVLYIYKSPRKGDEKILPEAHICFNSNGEFIYSDLYLKYTENKSKYDAKKQERNLVSNSTLPALTETINIIVKPTVKCSCCGNYKEDVDRKINYGMCIECFEHSKTDNVIKHNSIINNFRMKRNKDFIEKNYKIIE